MKHFWSFAVFSLLAAVSAGEVMKCENLSIRQGKIIPFRQTEPCFYADFSKDASFWDPAKKANYRELTEINFSGTKFGKKCLLVTRKVNNKETDTAWNAVSKVTPFRGKPGPVEILVEAAASVDLNKVQGCRNDIEWLGADGKVLGKTQLEYTGNDQAFSVSRCTGTVPSGTKSFIVRMGFDAPNIDIGTFCAIRSLRIAGILPSAPCVKNGFFETLPFASSGADRVSWKAETPAGTAVTVAVSTAKDQNGVPGTWSAFGPENSRPFSVSAPWVRFRITFHNSGNSSPVLKEFCVGNRKETIWCTRFKPAAPLVENKTVSPTRNTKNDVVLRVISVLPVNRKSFRVSVDGKDVSGKLIWKDDRVIYRAEGDYAPGKHTVKVSAADIAGNKADFTKYFMIGSGPSVPKITVRDDGMTLIDGKPFFPIGFYAVWKREFNNNDFDKCMRDLKAAGINFVHTYNGVGGPDGEKFLAAGRKYGMRFWVGMYSPTGKTFEKQFNNPDILAWYIGDDTSVNTTPAQLIDRNDHLRALDDKRITTQADCVYAKQNMSGYRDLVLGSDNFLPEIYPTRNDTAADRDASVPTVIRDMKVCYYDISLSRTDRPRSIWSIIQYFQGWGWKRFPEKNEIRAMSYASIIHGATGITWYTYGGYYNPKTKKTNYGVTSSPERWATITGITKELNRLIPVLTERSPEDQPPVPKVLSGPEKDVLDNPSVTCLLKRHNGKSYLLAVNSTRKTVKAQIRLPGLRGGKVLFEDRTCTLNGGVLTDEFKGHAVHVYELQ